ncbi:3-oxoacyl-ACP reductase (plasmid) [Acinetobacter sp. NCu2D-2]|uniref:SDR family NAD(P)-dependent oxidoreductase n=1 Tax=Acinetobacter sp. NCu2D-2 TaxID=1608473 RepID=UPI0007CDB585|nr:SDR family oxidoreductase [Acinetobacter sp. NCu2D-2]ANF83385.1 3-oxoacyl-ACP reductase [Acinetobacter sp. NCu2D-2]
MKKVALVTGAASGLGWTIAEHLASLDYQVIVSDVNPNLAQQNIASSQFSENMSALKLDISVREDFENAVNYVEQNFQQLDVVVNNAAVTKATPVLEITAEEFDWVCQVNQRGTFTACQVFGQYMASKGYGRMINLSSLAGQNGGTATGAHYAASKGAITTLTKIFAKQFAAQGVTVNAIAPGPMDSPMVRQVVGEENIEKFVTNIPVQQLGSMQFIAQTIALLAQPEAAFVTGATWDINGGLFMR